jgi:nucleotide-binding universal stress UspA family protein
MTTTTLLAKGFRKKSATPTLRFKKILAPVDFSHASEKGFKYALRCAEEFDAELTLLHVMEPLASTRFAAIPGAIAFPEIDFADAVQSAQGASPLMIEFASDKKVSFPRCFY